MLPKTARIILIVLTLCLAAAPAGAVIKPGAAVPDISLPDVQGQSHSLPKLLEGKVGLIVYWSVSCPHCRQEMPQLMDLHRRLAGNPFAMLMVNNDGPAMKQAAAAYGQDFAMPEPILLDAGPGDAMPLADAWDLIATPTVLVIDRTGKLVQVQEEKVDMDSLMKAIEASF